MCVIIDANLAAKILTRSADENFAPVFEWLQDPEEDGCVVYGGHLARELAKLHEPRRYLLALQRAGRARLIPTSAVEHDEVEVRGTGICRSDDPHIIALARVSGARTLCSNDRALHQDFRNKDLVDKPRGSVYQKAAHVHLLRHTSSCRQGKERSENR